MKEKLAQKKDKPEPKPEPITITPKPVIQEPIKPKPKPKKEKSICPYCNKGYINLNNHIINCPKRPGISEPKTPDGIYISNEQLEKVKPYTRLRFLAELLGYSGGSGKKKTNLKADIKREIEKNYNNSLEQLKKL